MGRGSTCATGAEVNVYTGSVTRTAGASLLRHRPQNLDMKKRNSAVGHVAWLLVLSMNDKGGLLGDAARHAPECRWQWRWQHLLL